jgi:hypothetical protein
LHQQNNPRNAKLKTLSHSFECLDAEGDLKRAAVESNSGETFQEERSVETWAPGARSSVAKHTDSFFKLVLVIEPLLTCHWRAGWVSDGGRGKGVGESVGGKKWYDRHRGELTQAEHRHQQLDHPKSADGSCNTAVICAS